MEKKGNVILSKYWQFSSSGLALARSFEYHDIRGKLGRYLT